MKKRKVPKRPSFGGQPVIPKLQAIGLKLNHPLVLQDYDQKQGRFKPDPETQKRLMCFSRIPACCLNSVGNGPNPGSADESAAHAMLDFFRLSISATFVDQLLACDADEAAEKLAPQIGVVFEEYEKALAADYMSINRCSQLEMTSAAILRGKEVKRRVLTNLKNPGVGYEMKRIPPADNAEPSSSTSKGSVAPLPQSPPKELKKFTNTAENPVILDDDDDEELSSTGEIVIVDEIRSSPLSTPKRESKTPSKSPSPELQSLREVDAYKKQQIHERIDRRNEGLRTTLNSVEYFGDANTSNSGPADVFCCLPGQTSREFTEAPSSDESEDDEVPRKRARVEEDDVVLLNMTSSSSTSTRVKDIVTDSDEEIGDIVDEWNEVDDSGEEVVMIKEEEDQVSTTTAPNGTANGFYDGYSTHQEFMKSHGLPFNYQAKTSGVVVNEKLCRLVERYVDSATEKQLDAVHRLSRSAWIHYEGNIQDEDTFNTKARARDLLHQEIQKIFPEKAISLHITGSTVNGCGSYNSDMDMCLCYPVGYRGASVDDFQCDKAHSTKVLRKLDKSIRRTKFGQAIRRVIATCRLIPAKVPIIKCDLTREFQKIDVDINVNNIAGIYNSHLTHYYSLIDARFPALALLVKHWSYVAGVNNAQDGYLNSYSIILLVVHYLQCGVSPAVLPNLQYLFPDKFDRKIPINELRLFGDIVESLPTLTPNKWSLGELVIGFFCYYNEFNFQTQAISIRSAQVVPRGILPRETLGAPIFVEEPFDAVNTARTVRTSMHMNHIKSEIRKACHTLSPHRNFRVEDIGVTVAED
uniref:PAP-associated domain-containing protein n=1 Tax=Caenorhabditis tropicalis TaxID=1561998 RepID=A0A1I7USS9_9PELO